MAWWGMDYGRPHKTDEKREGIDGEEREVGKLKNSTDKKMEEKSYTVNEISLLCGISEYYTRETLKRNNIKPVYEGSKRRGDGCRYKEEDIIRVFQKRFSSALAGSKYAGIVCPVCGEHSFEAIKWTHGLCGECWCRELNKSLIDKCMPLEEAVEETVARLKATNIIKQ